MGQQCTKVEKINWLKGVKMCNKFPKVAKNGLKIEILQQQNRDKMGHQSAKNVQKRGQKFAKSL